MGTQRHSGFDLEDLDDVKARLSAGSDIIGPHGRDIEYAGAGAGADAIFGPSVLEQVLARTPPLDLADLSTNEYLVVEFGLRVQNPLDKAYIWLQDFGNALVYASSISAVLFPSTSFTEIQANAQPITVFGSFTVAREGLNTRFMWKQESRDDSGASLRVISSGIISYNPRTDPNGLAVLGKCDNILDTIVPLYHNYFVIKKVF